MKNGIKVKSDSSNKIVSYIECPYCRKVNISINMVRSLRMKCRNCKKYFRLKKIGGRNE